MTSFSKAIANLVLYTSLAVLTGCASLSKPGSDSPTQASTGTPPNESSSSLRLSSFISSRSSSPAQTGAPLPTIEIASRPQQLPTVDLRAETNDLFQRIRNGFAMQDINNDLVLSHQQWYLNRPDQLRRMVERSTPYLHHIVEEIEKRGMPMELALLPMVESAYNPMAYSRARASGLWQFIPATGKRFKLDQNWWKDERRDIVASTAAALEYLQSIYEMHGDWHLALASYNWGEGAVARAVAKNRSLDLPTDYPSLTMPRETQNYVPKLQALKNIFSNPATLSDIGIPRIPNRPYFATVSKPTNIDVKLAAQLAEMPVQEFVALNPAHNRPIIVSDSPMVIPTEKLGTFVSNLEAHEGNNKPLSSWQSYTLRPGERLESIAPRFGMSVSSLRAVNGIKGHIKPSPGLTLLVAGNGNSDMTPLPGQPRLPEAESAPTASQTQSHTVRRGETLPAIAKQYGTSVAELRRTNRLRQDKISAGTQLTIPSAKDNAKGSAKSANKSNDKIAPSGRDSGKEKTGSGKDKGVKDKGKAGANTNTAIKSTKAADKRTATAPATKERPKSSKTTPAPAAKKPAKK